MKSQIEKLKKENDRLKKEIGRLTKRIDLISKQCLLNKSGIKNLENSKEEFRLVTVMNRTMIRVMVDLLEQVDVVDKEEFRQLCKKKYHQLVEDMEWRAIKSHADLSRFFRKMNERFDW